MLANEETLAAKGIKATMILHHKLRLVVFAEDKARLSVQTGNGVGAVLAHHHRLLELLVKVRQIGDNLSLDHLRETGVAVPAKVPVDHQHVQRQRHMVRVVVGVDGTGDGPLGRVCRPGQISDGLKVGLCLEFTGGRLIGDGPHEHRGAVFVALNQLIYGVLVEVQHNRVELAQADGGHLVDDDDSLAVRLVHDRLRVGVV